MFQSYNPIPKLVIYQDLNELWSCISYSKISVTLLTFKYKNQQTSDVTTYFCIFWMCVRKSDYYLSFYFFVQIWILISFVSLLTWYFGRLCNLSINILELNWLFTSSWCINQGNVRVDFRINVNTDQLLTN